MVDNLFAGQLGLITREQAVLAGLTERRVDLRLASGEWGLVHPGVYRLAGAPVSRDQLLLAAVLAAGDGSALSHRSAAVCHRTRAFDSQIIEVTVPNGRPRLAGVVLHRMADLGPDHIEQVGPIPLTRPERTLIDLGMVVGRPTVERILEEWLADRRITVATLRHALDAHAGRGRRGVGVAREALEQRVLGDEAGDSTDEHLVATVLRAFGCPPPSYHYLLRRGPHVLAELDYAYVPERVGVELLGYNPHTRTRRDFESFLARQNVVQAEGWVLLGYTPAMIRRRPWAVAREIRRGSTGPVRVALVN